jgi:hypothetical protein
MHHLLVDTDQIAGSFVVEVGFRQAWPFLGLCDNRPTPAQETRLYIDTSWTIEANVSANGGGANDDIAWLTAAVALNGRYWYFAASASTSRNGASRSQLLPRPIRRWFSGSPRPSRRDPSGDPFSTGSRWPV